MRRPETEMHSENENKESDADKNFLAVGTDFFRIGMNEARANREGNTRKGENKNAKKGMPVRPRNLQDGTAVMFKMFW